MRERMIDTIGKSSALVIGAVQMAAVMPTEEGDFLRVQLEVRDTLKGSFTPGESIQIDILAAGRETPRLVEHEQYLFFLMPSSAPEGMAPWRPEPWSNPTKVPANPAARDTFLKLATEVCRLSEGAAAPPAVKQYIFNALNAGLTLFRIDASRMARGLSGWTAAELEILANFLRDNGPAVVPAPERHNWVSLLARQAPTAQLVPFAETELSLDEIDGLYYGLAERQDNVATETLVTLLRQSNFAIQTRALQLAGLLRRQDIIDGFERQLSTDPHVSPNVSDFRDAFATARSLLTRD